MSKNKSIKDSQINYLINLLKTNYTEDVSISNNILSIKKNGKTLNYDLSVPNVTDSIAGLMTPEYKNKIDDIQDGAEKNQNAFAAIKFNDMAVMADNTQDIMHITSGNNISFNVDAEGDSILISATDTTYDVANTTNVGLMPQLSGGKENFLRGDGAWAIPPNTTYEVATQEQDGLIPALSGDKNTFLRGDGAWEIPPNTTYTAGNGIEIDADNCITNTGVLNITTPDPDPETEKIPIGSFKANINGTDTSISINGVETAYNASMANIPGALTWNGDIGNRYYVEIFNMPFDSITMSMGYVHITDEFPEMLNLMLQEGAGVEGGSEITIPAYIGGIGGDSAEYVEILLTISEDGFISGDDSIIYIPTDNYTPADISNCHFAKKGWYGMGYYYIMDGQYILMMATPLIMKIPGVVFTTDSMSNYFTAEKNLNGTSFVGDTLTWDENTDDRVYVELDRMLDDSGNVTTIVQLIKISNSIPTEEDFKNGCSLSIHLKQEGSVDQTDTIEMTYDNMVDNAVFSDDGVINISQYIIIIPHDNYIISTADGTTIVFPEAGIYYMYAYYGYTGKMCITSFTIPGYNFSELIYKTTDVIKTEYLPKHLRFGETPTMSYSDTLTWDGNINGLYAYNDVFFKVSDDIPTLQDMEDGYSFILINLGKEYEFTITAEEISEKVSVNGEFMNVSSYINIVSSSSGAYPKGVYFASTGDVYIKSFTINGYNGFKTVTTKIKTIDPKYLPDGYGSGSGTDTRLPTASSSDEGAFLRIVNGEWKIAHLPSVEEGEF